MTPDPRSSGGSTRNAESIGSSATPGTTSGKWSELAPHFERIAAERASERDLHNRRIEKLWTDARDVVARAGAAGYLSVKATGGHWAPPVITISIDDLNQILTDAGHTG